VAREEGKISGAPARRELGRAPRHRCQQAPQCQRNRETLWGRFNAPKEDQLWLYRELVKTFQKTAAPKALVGELERVVKELVEESL
jgi:hypothetical protein